MLPENVALRYGQNGKPIPEETEGGGQPALQRIELRRSLATGLDGTAFLSEMAGT
jgi:hypothetical protein